MASKKETAYDRIKQKIITNTLAPNTALNERSMMEQFDIGRTPLREIFLRLQEEGLVQIIPRVGTIVAPIDIKDIRQIVELRRELEGFAASLAARRISAGQLTRLRELTAEMQTLLDDADGDTQRLGKLDAEFHAVVYAAADNKPLMECLKRVQMAMYRHWHYGGFRGEAFLGHFRYLKLALEGLAAGDAEATRRALEGHVDDFVERLRGLLPGG